MDRRSFLANWLPVASRSRAHAGTKRSASLPADLTPFVPTASEPWDHVRAGHLLRRTTFMPRWSDIAALQAMTPGDAVDLLLDTTSSPAPPTVADSETESLDGLDQKSQDMIRSRWVSDAAILRVWWSDVMIGSGRSIQEKLTLFWSGHFTTEFVVDQDYVIAPLLYRQNKLLRENGLKNFKDLVMEVTLDGAMLVYLGGNLNSAGKPNENYARELMELFTTGLGWYTEGDVQNAARILTGWRVAQYNDKPRPNGLFATYFDARAHDIDAKQFLGESFPARDASTNTEYIVRRDEVRKLIDTIFERRAEAVAQFICKKLYSFFVYSSPSALEDPASKGVIDAMAALFIQSNFEIRPVLSALLKSAHFYDNANIGAQIKTPAELTIGLARELTEPTNAWGSMRSMGQELFNPPNVSGWPGYHDWITTNTFPRRSELSAAVLSQLDDATTLAFIRQFPEHTDAAKLVAHVGVLLLPRPLSPERSATLASTLTGGAPIYEWASILSSSPSSAARNMRTALERITELPDFQLS